jgi:hypothetical protein
LPQPFLPYGAYTIPQPFPQYSTDEVRTLFVAGLPEDIKPREIYNLFREFAGYESSHLRTDKAQPFAFAVFVDQHSATAAMHALNGTIFDLEKNSTLFVDLAKSNSRSKRSRIDDGHTSEKRNRGPAPFLQGVHDPGAGIGSYIHTPGMANPAYNFTTTLQSHGVFDGSAVTEAAPATLDSSLVSYLPQDPNACPTLFVADLGPTCTEEELVQLFSRFPGYLKLKMQSTFGAPVAFVDFQDAMCSSEARNRLQGTVLYSSFPGKGVRLEYAKSRMGMRGRKAR